MQCTWIVFISLGDSSIVADASNDIIDTSTDQHSTEFSSHTSKKREELELAIATLESQLNEAVIAESYDEAGILYTYN